MDKQRIKIICGVFLLCVCLIPTVCTHALVSDDIRNQYETEIFKTVTDEPYTGSDSFDGIAVLPQKGFILVHSSGIDHYIDIYDPVGQFVRGYKLTTAELVLASFDGENNDTVVFYLIREGISIRATAEGAFICATAMQNTSEVVNTFSALAGFTISHAGITYAFTDKNPFSKNSQCFTVINTDGNVLFSYTPNVHASTFNTVAVIMYVCIAAFCIVMFFGGKHRFSKKKK